MVNLADTFALNPKTIVEGEAFAKALTDFAVGKADDLFAAIGYGKIQAKQLLVRLVPVDSLRENPTFRDVSSKYRVLLLMQTMIGGMRSTAKGLAHDDSTAA